MEWVRRLGTSSDDFGESVAINSADKVFVTGSTKGSLGGPYAGSMDAFLAKYSATGNLVWKRQLGTGYSEESESVAVDSEGNAFICGVTSGNIRGVYYGGLSDAFIAKYSGAGHLRWTRQIGTTSSDECNSVAVDAAGNVFICGVTGGSLGAPNGGSWDAFIAKYSANGNVQWTRQIGTGFVEYCDSVAVNGAGEAFISGSTFGSLGAPNAGKGDAYIAKYSATGALLWVRQIGTNSFDWSNSVAVDGAGNAFISGATRGSIGGPNAGSWDAFVAKYSPNGNLRWTRQLGTSEWDESYAVGVDTAGNPFISGKTQGILAGTYAGSVDAFIASFSATGALLWTHQVGTSFPDMSLSIAIDDAGLAYICGVTQGSFGGPNAGGFDAFVAKLSPAPPKAEMNRSSGVNVDDMLTVISAWGPCVPSPLGCPADIAPPDGDGVVGTDDLLAVISGWGAYE